MLEWIAALLLIAISYCLLRFGLWLLTIYKDRHQQYLDAAHLFYDVATKLLKRDDLSKNDVEFIDDLASTMNDPHTAMVFLRVLQKRKKAPTTSQKSPSRISDHLVNEQLGLHYFWFTAVTARSPVFGSLVRLTIAQQSIPAVVKEVSHKANVAHKSHRLAPA